MEQVDITPDTYIERITFKCPSCGKMRYRFDNMESRALTDEEIEEWRKSNERV